MEMAAVEGDRRIALVNLPHWPERAFPWRSERMGRCGLGARIVPASSATVGPILTRIIWRRAASPWAKPGSLPLQGTKLPLPFDKTEPSGRGEITRTGNWETGRLHYRYAPVQIGSASNWEDVATATGGYHSVGIRSDGTLWYWGYEAGTAPSQLGSDTDWKSVTAGYEYSWGIERGWVYLALEPRRYRHGPDRLRHGLGGRGRGRGSYARAQIRRHAVGLGK